MLIGIMCRLSTILLAMLLVGCYNAADKLHIKGSLPTPTTTISGLYDIVGSGGVVFDKETIAVGRVVSSDAEDNFYRTLVVEADGRAVEVMVGMSELATLYPVGLKVALRVGGCYADLDYGIMQIGRKGVGSYAVDYLASREAMDRVLVRSTDIMDVEPKPVMLAELHGGMCGRLVRIEALHLTAASSVEEDENLDEARWAGYTTFKDAVGDSIVLYTRDYARFAAERVPHGDVDLSGILQWGEYEGKECFQLKMRYAEDCSRR